MHAAAELGWEPSEAQPTALQNNTNTVGTTAGGYLVTKGKPPSQGEVTGCLESDFRDVRIHTTAVWVMLKACHIPVVLILLFTEIKIVFLHGART